jgi:hypothetical protein
MKVTVTHLKAPWPEGAAVGQVVDLPGVDKMPGWAAGKCTPADDDAEAAHVWVAPQPVEAEPAAAVAADPDRAALDASLRAAAEQEAAELRDRLTAAETALADKGASLDKALADLAEQGQKLAAAESALAAAQAAAKKAAKG